MLEKDTHARPFSEADNTQRRVPFNRNPSTGALVRVLSDRSVAQMTRFPPPWKGTVYHHGMDGAAEAGIAPVPVAPRRPVMVESVPRPDRADAPERQSSIPGYR